MKALRCVLNELSTDTINEAEKIKKEMALYNQKNQYIHDELFNILWASRRPDSLEDYYAEFGENSPKKYWEQANEIKKKHSSIFEELRNGNDFTYGVLCGMIGGIREMGDLMSNVDLDYLKQFDYDEDNASSSIRDGATHLTDAELKKMQDVWIQDNLDNIFSMKLHLDS